MEVQENFDIDPLLTMKDVGNIMHMSRATVDRLVHQSDFPKMKIGHKVLIPQSKFKEWLNQRMYKEYDY